MFKNKKYKNLFMVLLLIFSAEIFFSAYQEAPTWDERCYIGTGKYIMNTGNFKNIAIMYQPPLSYYLNSVFLYFIKFDKSLFDSENCWDIGNKIIFHSGYPHWLILFLTRLPFMIVALMASFYVFKFASMLYGEKSGVFAVFLYVFSPNIVGYSTLATTDFLITVIIFITIYHYWMYLNNPTKLNMIFTGIAVGFAEGTKITGLLLYPIIILIGILNLYFKKQFTYKNLIIQIKSWVWIFIIGFLIVMILYGFQFKTFKSALPEYYVNRAHQAFDEIGILKKINAKKIFDNIPVPVPSYFGGLGSVSYLTTKGLPIFVLGRILEKNIFYFPILVFLLKTTLSLLILIIISIILFRKIRRKSLMDELILVIPIVIIFGIFVFSNKVSGIRHVLPIYPFIFLFVSKIMNYKAKNKKIFILFMTIFVLHYAVNAIIIAPYYLSYTNEFAGGFGNAYKFFVASAIDQGQDLARLKAYMDKKGVKSAKLSYFGSIDPKDYNISYEYLPSPYFQPWVTKNGVFATESEARENCSSITGIIAISVTNLQNLFLVNKSCFRWLHNYEPVKKIGYTIFVYNISSAFR